MQRLTGGWLRAGRPIALVPTMGCLHAGHLRLVQRARRLVGPAGAVVTSIYVNPTQFGANEDLDAYPRDLRGDLAACRQAGVDVVFAPTDAEMYPKGFSTFVNEEHLSGAMEGRTRPTHFRGVTTVVTKLFTIVRPDVAVFGAKDWQQATIIRRLVRDLNLPVKLVIAPTVRERDGLALSSRNANLAAAEREQAIVLHEALKQARSEVRRRSGIPARELRSKVKRLFRRAPLARLDYVEFFHPDTLEPVREVTRGTHMALAAFFSRARLIDNGRL